MESMFDWLDGTDKLPIILQAEASECGLACVAMVSAYFGRKHTLSDLRELARISERGANLEQLIEVSQKLKLDARAVRVDLDYLYEVQQPIILHWNFTHFVVLSSVGRTGVTIHDPAFGARTIRRSELSESFTGVALELSPSIDFPKISRPHGLQLIPMVRAVNGLFSSAAQIFILAVMIELFALLLPLFTQMVFDDALIYRDDGLLFVLISGLVLCVLLRTFTEWLRTSVTIFLTNSLTTQWSMGLFAHLLRIVPMWFSKRHLGDITSRLSSINSVQQTLSSNAISALFDGVLSFVLCAVLFVYSKTILAVVLLVTGTHVLLRILQFRRVREETIRSLNYAAKQQSHLVESIRCIQAIKLANCEAGRSVRYMSLLSDTLNSGVRIQRTNSNFAAINNMLFGIQTGLILLLGAQQVNVGALSVGMLIAVVAYKDQFVMRVSGLVEQLLNFKMLRVHLDRIEDIALAETEIASSPQPALDLIDTSIEVRNVSFSYGSDSEQVFYDVCFRVESGESVAIRGPSGCGKSTLVKLLLGLVPLQKGEILIGGIPISQLGTDVVRKNVAAVMQDDQLLAGTISENIAFFDVAASEANVRAAAVTAGIHDEIQKMPMRYSTRVGEMGSSLSGGQKQRLLLARAIYRDPKLLLLDEATSSLDPHAERQVNRAVKALSITRLIVAHRESTISMADRVIDFAQFQAARKLT